LCGPKDHQKDDDCKRTTVESIDSENHNHCCTWGSLCGAVHQWTYVDKLVGNKQEVRNQ
jgi:hypothetical protein